jgi:hypothetical protein
MDSKVKVSKVLRQIYSIDYSKILLKNGDEFVTESNGMSDLNQYLRKNDMDTEVLVSFAGYRNGLFYTTNDGGEIFNDPSMLPELVTFSMDLVGLKKNLWYRVSITAKNTGNITTFSTNRKIQVTDGTQALIIDCDLNGVNDDTEYIGYFRSNSAESYLFFTIGKVIIKDIHIEEVEIEGDAVKTDDKIETIGPASLKLCAYGCFAMKPEIGDFKGRYVRLNNIAGTGLELYFDITDTSYVLERSNDPDILGESFTGYQYLVSINKDKLKSEGIFSRLDIVDVNGNLSPNTLKQGYIEFALVDDNGLKVKYPDAGRVVITVEKMS